MMGGAKPQIVWPRTALTSQRVRTSSFCNVVDSEWDDTMEYDLQEIDRLVDNFFYNFDHVMLSIRAGTCVCVCHKSTTR